ncbi:MAG: efflux RND transporter permease subunit [Deltaproteobacteria bacterium]|nr:efflux RND transporter permease subunit [Candidatus Zymogenaceae bacterium]
MSISRFSVKNSVLINMITVAVLILGVYHTTRLSREVFPSVDFGYIRVTTTYSGASPEEIEKLITIPIEDEISDIDGIEEITSTSSEGVSSISIKAEANIVGAKLDRLLDDVKNEVDKVNDIPEDADDPNVVKREPRFDVITIGIWGDADRERLQETADRLKDELELVEGVSTVEMEGYRDREIWVEVDPRKLESLSLNLDEIVAAIKQQNRTIPGGSVDSGSKELLIRSIGEVVDADDLGTIVIRSYPETVLTLKDVAKITETFEEETSYNRLNGRRAVLLTVKKNSSGDVIDIARDVRAIVENEREHLESGMTLSLVDDEAAHVIKRQKTLLFNALLGMFLVILILYAFLDSRVAFWASVGIPFSFLSAIIIMSFMGITLNLLTMFALILVLGIVVDDAIVVSENFFRYREMGYTVGEASVRGADEVLMPVVAAIATNIAAFVPLFLISGIIGKFLKFIPLVVIVTLVASLVEAFLILPSHLNEFAKNKGAEAYREVRTWFSPIREYYGRVLGVLLNRRYLVFLSLFGVAVVTIIFGLFTLRFVFMGQSIAETFRVSINMPTDSNLEETDTVVREIEDIIAGRPEEEISAIISSVGGTSTSYRGRITVELTEYGYRKIGAESIIEDIREQTDMIAGPTSIVYRSQRRGPSSGSPVEVKIQGDEFSTILDLVEDFETEMEGIEGIVDITNDYERGKEEIQFTFDRYVMGALGLNITDVAGELRTAFSGSSAGDVIRGTDSIDIVVKFDEEMQNIERLMNFSILNPEDYRIPLRTFSEIVYNDGMLSINHIDRERTLTVTANVIEGELTSKEANEILIDTFGTRSTTYPGYTFTYGGEYEDTMESIFSLLRSLFLALLIIYIILAALFRSYLQPFIIMATVPFSFIGVVLGLFIMNIELSLMAGIGIIALVGIVVNDSIVMVDFINKERDKGMDIFESVVETGKIRLRPILLTSLTTIGGLFPMAIGIGGREPMLTPMAVSIVWGLAFAVLLTLIVIPCLYIIVEDIKKRFRRIEE